MIYDSNGNVKYDDRLTPSNTYYYKAFTYDKSLNYSTGLSLNGIVTRSTASTSVTGLAATSDYTNSSITWNGPSDPNYNNFMVVRSKINTAPLKPVDDIEYSVNSSDVVYIGNGTTFNDYGLEVATRYIYVVYPIYRYTEYDEEENVNIDKIKYGTGCEVSVTTVLRGALAADLTLMKKDNPHIISDKVIVPEGVTLTIEPGTVVKFAAVKNSCALPGILVKGTLKAEGLTDAPIIFTSVNDHSVGGATGSGTPNPGDWNAIFFDPTSLNSVLSHAVVKYGGYSDQACESSWDWVEGAIDIYSSSVSIANSEINSNKTGIYVTAGTSPTISACNILNNTGQGILIDGASPRIQSSIFRQNTDNGIKCINTSLPIITGNTFDSNGNWAVLMDSTSSGASSSGNKYIGARPFSVITGGTLSANTTWTNGDPYVIAGQVIVPEGVTLTVEPGTVVKFQQASCGLQRPDLPGILVQGTIKAEGLTDAPIIFTSVNDHSVGGATGSGTPNPGDWDAILFDPTSLNSVLSHAVVKYGGYSDQACESSWDWVEGAIDIYSSSVSIANSEINSNKTGIYVTAGTSPTISACNILNNTGQGILIHGASPIMQNSSFFSNDGYGIFNSGPTVVNATNNNWGDPSGPLDDSDDRSAGGLFNPTGKGNRVSDHVNYYPWIGLSGTVTLTLNSVTTPTRLTSQDIGGTVEAGAGVNVTLNNGTPLPATVTGTAWTFTVTGLIPGANSIQVTATDQAGNTTVTTASITLIIPGLTVTMSGTGGGLVTSSPVGIDCPDGSCSAFFEKDSAIILVAAPNGISEFAGWSGACTGRDGCMITMDSDKSVTANFTAVSPARIPGATPAYFSLIKEAYAALASSGAIQLLQYEFEEKLLFNRGISLLLKGGYDTSYTNNTGYATVKGSLTIINGSLTVDQIVIK